MRYFNTEGLCDPEIHYMVNLDERLQTIRERYVERGSYFVINRGRQYGKTTTLWMLEEYLSADYYVVSLDFQTLSTADYQDEYTFTEAFMRVFDEALEEWEDAADVQEIIHVFLTDREKYTLGEMFTVLSRVCRAASRPIVLMIDEVDSASNNRVFIDFLAQLRAYYLKRRKKPIFQSVILAGVYDIRNLKLKIRPEEEHQYNSPWNIAANFDLDMDFSAEQIAGMLREYETDHQTGMNVDEISEEIYRYTSGYPYLVSLICKTIDETLSGEKAYSDKCGGWTREGIAEVVNRILKAKTPLFDSMTKQLDSYPDLREMLEDIIYQGKRIPFSPDIKSINMGLMFAFLKDKGGQIVVSNRIFEMRLLNMFITEESVNSGAFQCGENNRNQFVKGKRLDMDLALEKFVEYFTDIYSDNDEKFVEAYGRKFFLLYLKPIINGTGNYYLEAQTRDASRTDVIVDYLGQQFVVELKIWRGNEYNERGERQLTEYLDYYHLDKGYLLSFNFNKKKEVGVKELRVGDKVIVEAVV